MAKYHWNRITDDPELNRELMVTFYVEDEDEDALWPQLPDVCSEGALPFMHASCGGARRGQAVPILCLNRGARDGVRPYPYFA